MNDYRTVFLLYNCRATWRANNSDYWKPTFSFCPLSSEISPDPWNLFIFWTVDDAVLKAFRFSNEHYSKVVSIFLKAVFSRLGNFCPSLLLRDSVSKTFFTSSVLTNLLLSDLVSCKTLLQLFLICVTCLQFLNACPDFLKCIEAIFSFSSENSKKKKIQFMWYGYYVSIMPYVPLWKNNIYEVFKSSYPVLLHFKRCLNFFGAVVVVAL